MLFGNFAFGPLKIALTFFRAVTSLALIKFFDAPVSAFNELVDAVKLVMEATERVVLLSKMYFK